MDMKGEGAKPLTIRGPEGVS